MNNTNQSLFNKHQDILSFRDLAPSTLSTYTSYLTSYINWVEDNLPEKALASVTWEEIRSYIRYLKDIRHLNPRTINVHISQLRDFFYYVLHKDWDNREVPLLHFDEKLPIVPTKAEVIALIDSINNPKHKAEIALLYSSGIRISELCRLKCKDIIRGCRCIHISKAKNRSERYAVLSEKALVLLVRYVKTSYRNATLESWLFPGQRPGTHICTGTVSRVFSAHLVDAGLSGKGYVPHSLRHAFGLHLYESGADLMSIKEALGHKSLSSTTIYLTLGVGNGRTVRSPYDD